jgi:hypothetical protein
MPEIGTLGLMSGDGKRGVCQSAPSYRAHPRLYKIPAAGERACLRLLRRRERDSYEGTGELLLWMRLARLAMR